MFVEVIDRDGRHLTVNSEQIIYVDVNTRESDFLFAGILFTNGERAALDETN